MVRMHVGARGGAAFLLSSAIPIEGDRAFAITAQLRYVLSDRGDEADFVILEFDDRGAIIAEHHLTGRPADSMWQWQARTQAFATTPQTRAIRIRFGLAAAAESYLDIDSVR
jgi:hypothetical protein